MKIYYLLKELPIYDDLDRFSQHNHTLLKMNFNIILAPELISSKEVLRLGFPIKILYAFLISSMFVACLAHVDLLLLVFRIRSDVTVTVIFMQFHAPFCSYLVQPNSLAPCPKHLESVLLPV